MNLQPGHVDRRSRPSTGRPEIVEVLEHVLAIAPDHPGANHFYIHAVEASPDPGRATAAAERLLNLVPGSGHLVHMPSHIFIRTGRYADAADSNERAIAADEAYCGCSASGLLQPVLHAQHPLPCIRRDDGGSVRDRHGRAPDRDADPESFLREYVTFADGFMPTRCTS